MLECEKVRKKLSNIYGEKVLCRIGEGDPTYNASTQDYKHADMAVYIHEKNRKAIVWNLKNRRLNNQVIEIYSIQRKWDDLNIQNGQIMDIYKKMGTKRPASYEKVLVLDVDTLFSISEELHLYVKINPLDNEYPNGLDATNSSNYDILDEADRERVSTSRWERDR